MYHVNEYFSKMREEKWERPNKLGQHLVIYHFQKMSYEKMLEWSKYQEYM